MEKTLTVFKYNVDDNVIEAVDSRQVAEMTGKNHKDLLRDIRGYIEIMEQGGQRKIAPSDFFIQSSYVNSQNKEQPCYLLTKKGCDMVANKMTGEKGVLFTAAYVTAFEDMRKEIETKNMVPDSIAEARLKEVELARYNALVSLADRYKGTYHDVLMAHATKELAGEFLLPLPETEEPTYSAAEIGKMIGGISANKIGRIAKEHNLKTEEYGKWYHDKSKYSSKEVDTFKYYERAADEFKKYI